MSEDNSADATRAGGPPCPICGKPAIVEYKPFCSRRCADIDLGRWLKGGYAIPAKETEDEDDAADGKGDEEDVGPKI